MRTRHAARDPWELISVSLTPLIVAFTVFAMLHGTRPLLTLYAASLGANAFGVGLLIAAYSALPLLLAVHAGKVTDAIGNRVPAVLGTVGAGIGLLIPFLFPTLPGLFASQVIFGVSSMFVVLSVQNVLGQTATPETRDHHFAMFTLAASAAGVVGPIASGYLGEQLSYPQAFLVAATVGVAATAASLALPAGLLRVRGVSAVKRASTLQLLKVPALRRAMASSALVLYSRDIYIAYFPLLATGMGLSEVQIGWVIALQAAAMMAVRFWLAALVRAFGRERLLFGSILVAGFACAALPLLGQVYALALFSVAIGLGLGSGQPLSMTTTYNASPEGRTAEAMGLRLAINRASLLAAPLLFGALGAAAGVGAVFYASGALLVQGAFLIRERN